MINYIKNFFYNKNLVSNKKSYSHLDGIFFSENASRRSDANCYKSNVIVNRCVNIISQAAGHVPWIVLTQTSQGLQKKSDHRACKLLKRPNPNTAGAEFFCEIIATKLLFGNSYILGVGSNQAPIELHSLNPLDVEVILNNSEITGYKYAGKKIYSVNPLSKQSQVLHIKNYNPASKIYGLSCLDPANKVIDLHNRATDWNHTLLKNGARPSGALIVNGGNYLSDEQFSRLKQELQEKYYGSNNAGKPMLLEGGLDWKEMSISPKDMDFIESKNSAAREIALAFGVPPQLLGINGDNTYSNMQEARLALWEETIIPLLDKIADSLTNWLSQQFNEEIVIDFDRDCISLLTARREKLWMTLTNIGFMSINEKRALVGLSEVEGGDKIEVK
jgi:HK97 family phage portal protein